MTFVAPRFSSAIPHSMRLSFSDCTFNKSIVSIVSVLQFEVASTCCFSEHPPKLIRSACFLDRKRDGDFLDALFSFLCHKILVYCDYNVLFATRLTASVFAVAT